MTYKLNPELRKISSPVVLLNGEDRIEYESGKAVAEAEFDKRYLIRSLRAVGNIVEIELEVAKPLNEEVSFF